MKTDKVKIFGIDLLLTERTVFDVYEYEKTSREAVSDLDRIYFNALFIEIGLKYNYTKLLISLFIFGREFKICLRPFKYLKLKKMLSAGYLIKHLSAMEIDDLIDRIWFMETGERLNKKKVKTEQVKIQSAETMQSV